METAEFAKPLSGDKLYQKRARKALPLLVRQAIASSPIVYEDLARELEMPNPRNLNYVLGSIGQSLRNLSEYWGHDIPPIQCLVLNKNTRLPGAGVGWFIVNVADFKKLSTKQKRQIVEVKLQKIFAFPSWPEVLSEFGLEPIKNEFEELNTRASNFRGGGEGAEHKRLRGYLKIPIW